MFKIADDDHGQSYFVSNKEVDEQVKKSFWNGFFLGMLFMFVVCLGIGLTIP